MRNSNKKNTAFSLKSKDFIIISSSLINNSLDKVTVATPN